MNAYEIAKIFNVTPVTVYNWVQKGLPHKVITQGTKTSMRFDQNAVEKWVKENQNKNNIKRHTLSSRKGDV